MRPIVSVLALAALLAGCGVPRERSEQAKEIESVAAEGRLLAEGAADGSTTGPFTHVHAEALRDRLGTLEPAIEDERLVRLANEVDEALEPLSADPGDKALAASSERRLESAATAAQELAR